MPNIIETAWLESELDYCVAVGVVKTYGVEVVRGRGRTGQERRFVVTLPDDEVRHFDAGKVEAFTLGVRWATEDNAA